MFMDKKEFIIKINNLLIKEYGIPERAKQVPDPLDLLVATILSQNTNDNNSFRAYNNLKNYINSYEDIQNMELETLMNLIKPAGLTKQKAETIKNLIEYLISNYGSANLGFIHNFNDEFILNLLTNIKGIGVKTASCVLLFSLYRDICPVDTHVHRIINRLGIVNAKTAEKSFYELNKEFPKGIAHAFHTNLIKHGRKVCRPKEPFCPDCILNEFCSFNSKTNKKIEKIRGDRILLLDNI